MSRLTHHVRLLIVALAAVCAVAFNHRHVAMVRHVAAAGPHSTVVKGTRAVVVRERVSLESIHADVVAVAGPVAEWFPPTLLDRDPLGTWLNEKTPALGTLPTLPVRAVARAVPALARLLRASVAPQAP